MSVNRYNYAMLKSQSLLPRRRMLQLLDETGRQPVDFTLYIKAGTTAGEMEKELAKALDRGMVFDEIVEKAALSATGAVIFYGRGRALVIWPPFPLKESGLSGGYDGERLKKEIEREPLIGLVLVRLGQYAVGIFRGEEMVEGKAGTGLVHARHHKGGSSANRFARHREKQMEYFFTRVEQHSRELLEGHIREIDYFFYGGTRDTLHRLWRQCLFFKKLEDKKVDRLLSLREPRRSNLRDAATEALSSRVFELIE